MRIPSTTLASAALFAISVGCGQGEGRPADAPIGQDRAVAPPVACMDGGCDEIDAALADIIAEGGGSEAPVAEPFADDDLGGGVPVEDDEEFVAVPLELDDFVDDTCFDEGCLEGSCDELGCNGGCNGGLGCGEESGGSEESGGCGDTDESGGSSESGDAEVQCAPEDKAPAPGIPPEGSGYTQLDGNACKWLYDGYITKSQGGVCGLRRMQWGPDYVNVEYADFIAKKCKDKPTGLDKLKCISEQIRAWLGPFNKKGFVCRHNAVAFYWVLDSLGMAGDAEVETDKDYKHAWVSIVIDGVRYHIDPMNNCILSIDPKK
jgi:hypothetical protein